MRIENDLLRVTVLKEGGHIAELLDKRAGVSPLWVPHWPSVEPSQFRAEAGGPFGAGPDAKLLAGIMGHNLCLDLFGGPSDEEALLGMTVHGEASVDLYDFQETSDGLQMSLTLQLAQLGFSRWIGLYGESVCIRETVENLANLDRPLAWTQHVTLGPPFLEPTETEFRTSMDRSIVAENDPGFAMYLVPGAEFRWPDAPRCDGGVADLRRMNASAPASGYTAHLSGEVSDTAYFTSFTAKYRLALSYVWRKSEFPWLGIWEENCSRVGSPWDGKTVTRGMEFGVSPFPESRRQMIDRGQMLGQSCYKWIAARARLEAEYWIRSQIAEAIPEPVIWPGK